MRLLLFGLCLTFMVACCPAKKTCCQKTEKTCHKVETDSCSHK